ncbi:MAG: hypothetical protein JXQ91_04790 [Vannielia sp.]|uniref:hypothetical protein n=1 Tax=Vannielia sp. TaxID=2813045 RepID=UPI003B8C0807
MALSTSEISRALAKGSKIQQDDIARYLMMNATSADISALEAEGALMLYNALAFGNSQVAQNRHALTQIQLYSRFSMPQNPPDEAAAEVVANIPGVHAVQAHLTGTAISNIYVEEGKRLNWLERRGIDGDSIGRGQLTQKAYDEVRNKAFPGSYRDWVERVAVGMRLQTGICTPGAKWGPDFTTVAPHSDYAGVINEPLIEDFVVGAYLALQIKYSEKAGRAPKDAARFGAGRYFGAYESMSEAQEGLGKNALHWPFVALKLRMSLKGDIADYCEGVFP